MRTKTTSGANEESTAVKEQIIIPMPSEDVGKGVRSTQMPVRVQRSVVSKKTSIIPKSPTDALEVKLRPVCAEADVPAPASFESSPLANPSFTELSIKKDDTPPYAERKSNASEKIEEMTVGRFVICVMIINIHIKT